MTYKSFLAQRNADIDTYENGGYFSRLLRSWPIPVFVLLVIATHWLVETLVRAGFLRGILILISFFISPLIVSTLIRKRKALIGAIMNGCYITLGYCDFYRGLAFRVELMVFLAMLAFGLMSGAGAGSFHERLCKRFGNRAEETLANT
ncbi:MAG TPA: hypothetical protein VJ124_10330 [Pyrinomonadaceae bacterium]|nr:hypothetical protein [Pyrinomonadaceae bacterium]